MKKIALVLSLILASNNAFSQNILKIGDEFQGGIVAYLDGSGGGLIITKSDLGLKKWSSAKNICKKLNIDGFNDWYLPSKIELNLIYSNKDIIGGFTPLWYWSSSEHLSKDVWGQDFNSGEQDIVNRKKSSGGFFRAIRAF